MPNHAQCFGAFDNGKIVAFIGVIHFPHPKNPKIKSVSRLCVLPDYQGIGIGKKLLNFVAKIYADEGFDVKITTSAKNLIFSLVKDEHWILQRYSANKKAVTTNISCMKLINTIRSNCKTASFYFKNF